MIKLPAIPCGWPAAILVHRALSSGDTSCWAISSVGLERPVYTRKVGSSSLSSPTNLLEVIWYLVYIFVLRLKTLIDDQKNTVTQNDFLSH